MNPAELIDWWEGELNWCGCGNPEAALALTRDVLRAVADHSAAVRSARDHLWPPSDAARGRSDALQARLDELLPTQGTRWITLYALDAAGLLEHGGCLPGWPTDLGLAVLAGLEAHGCDLAAWSREEEP